MFTNKKSLLALSVVSALTLSGCGSDNDNNQPTPPVEPPVVVTPEAPAEIGTVVFGNVIDSGTSNVVAAKIMFLENGEPSTNLVDVDGNLVSSVSADDGSFTLQLKEGASVSEVTAVVVADSYITKSYIIDLAGLSEGDLEVQLAAISKTAAGISTAEIDATVSGGSSAAPITAGTSNGKKASAAITVPGGTILQNSAGDAITGDTVKVGVTGASTSSTAGAAITPQGLNAAGATNVLTPVGIASVEIVDSAGVKVKKFSNDITVSMAIPDDKGFVTGDELTLVSQNEDTGVWATESQKVTVGTLVASDGYYNASFETDHLTFFSAVKSAPACTTSVRVLVGNGDPVPAGGLFVNLISTDYAAKGELKAGATDSVIISETKASREGITAGAMATVEVSDSNGNVWYTSDTEVAVCGDINVTLANPVSYVDETLSLSAQCSNNTDLAIGASGALVQYSLSGKAKKVARGTDGVYALNSLVSGETYSVTVDYKGSLKDIGTKTYTVTADGTDESQTESLTCATTTGGN